MIYHRLIIESFSNDDGKDKENCTSNWKFADYWLFCDYPAMSTLKLDCYAHRWIKCRELKIYSCKFELWSTSNLVSLFFSFFFLQRTARAARLLSFTPAIKFLICDVFVVFPLSMLKLAEIHLMTSWCIYLRYLLNKKY